MNIDAFKRHLRWAEGVRNYPYEDTLGHLTIGCGRNLDANGLTDEEVEHLLHTDVTRTLIDAQSLEYWDSLSDTRKLVVADLVFNMGLPRWKGFIRANAALRAGDWEEAAEEMRDSRWYRQTGRRARKLVKAMRTDEWDAN